MTVWLNGALYAPESARIDPSDRGFTLGDGVFETIRLSGGKPMHLARHLRRLRDGAHMLDIPVVYDNAAIAAAILAVISARGLMEGAARLTLTRGPAPRGVTPPVSPTPTLLVVAGTSPLAAASVRAIISGSTRRNQASPLSRIKSLNYLDNVLARQEATRQAADEALLLNTQGALAEASAANLFLLRHGMLVTPSLADGALPGIMRALLIERCGAVERSICPDDLFAADGVFLSSSLGLRIVSEVDGRRVRRNDDRILECVDAAAIE
jgi:branched-chain amino acid aminotransferase